CHVVKTSPGETLMTIRACFENAWRGRSARCHEIMPSARTGRRPADRNCREQRCEKAVLIGSNCRSRSVRRVAGRHRRVACATSKPIFRHALRPRRPSACVLSLVLLLGVAGAAPELFAQRVESVKEKTLNIRGVQIKKETPFVGGNYHYQMELINTTNETMVVDVE